MERTALRGLEFSKVWYCLTKDGDLLITKLASGDVHSKCVHKLGHFVENFCDQYPNVFDGDGVEITCYCQVRAVPQMPSCNQHFDCK